MNIRKILGKEPKQERPIFWKVFNTWNKKTKRWQPSGFNKYKCMRVFRDELKIVLRSKVRDPYMLNKNNNCYESVSVEDLQILINEDMGEYTPTTPEQIKKALNLITNYVTPSKDVISFKNGQYDLAHSRLLPENEQTPKLCLVNIPYNYRYDAEPKYIKDFLESSLAEKTPEETMKKIIGLYEVVAYLLTTGNPKNKLFFLSGVPGSGKSILAKILTLIVGGHVSHVDLQNMSNNRFAFSQYVDARINIVTDSSNGIIKDNGPIKSASGDDDIIIERKGKDPFTLPADQVPKTVIMCNQMPVFKDPEDALISRLIILEFKRTFRDTKDQIEDLFDKIKNSTDDIEWFIFNCLDAYENMRLSKSHFTLQAETTKQTRLLFSKHSDPLAWCIENLFESYNEPEIDEYGKTRTDFCVKTKDVNRAVVLFAQEEGVAIPLGKNGRVTGRRLTSAIRRALDIEDENFGTRGKKFDGKNERCYCGLVPTPKFDELLSKIVLEN